MLYGVFYFKENPRKKWEWLSASVNTKERLTEILNDYIKNNPGMMFKLVIKN